MTEVAPVQVSQPVESPESPTADYGSSKHKVKIDGQEIEVGYEDLISGYQLKSSSQKKYDEAATLRKQVDQFLDDLNGGNWDVLSELMPEDKVLDLAESYLRKKVEWEELPESDKKRIKAEKERDKYKEKIESYEEKEYRQSFEKINYEAEQRVSNEIADALESITQKYGDIKVTPELVEDIARMLLAKEDSEDLDANKAAEISYKRLKNRFNNYISDLSTKDLKKLLNKSQLKSLMDEDLNESMTQLSSGKRQVSRLEPRKGSKKTKGVDSWLTTIEKRIGV